MIRHPAGRTPLRTLPRRLCCLLIVSLLLASGAAAPLAARPEAAAAAESAAARLPVAPTIQLRSRWFRPGLPDIDALARLAPATQGRVHILVQLDFIPRRPAREAYRAQGLRLLAYVPDYAWIASAPAANPAAVLQLPGVVWAGELTAADKLDPAIRAGAWSPHNRSTTGIVAVTVTMHQDENVPAGRDLVAGLGGEVTGVVQGLNLLMAELPEAAVAELAAADAVQWIAPAAPPLAGANDGLRGQIGADEVNGAPYSLDGAGIDVLVYDGGRVGSHIDFGTRLTAGDVSTLSEHATHVAGVIGGSGANSAAEGGAALQWQGVAPNVDLISYGLNTVGGILFYQDVADIETDWAAGQNTYGADVGAFGLSSQIYANYPGRCDLMGRYGATAALLDQIVRGGNSVVGLGDKYIAIMAVGNERGWATSCGTYATISPPAAAKNAIQVGGAYTNDNTQYMHGSWGPTGDGRLKPIITAGACQTTGDGGVTSTDNYPADTYTVKCGTSMASSAVAGSVALMLQHYRAVTGASTTFWPATARAILIQTAADYGNPGPDYQWGYGLVDVRAAVDLISRRSWRQESIDQSEVDLYAFIVPEGSDPARVTLAWDDYEATLNANPALVNNLDLELVSPGGDVWRPWILNPASPTSSATRGVDGVNNQEQVTVPSPETGTWLVRVRGTVVPQGPQAYALACEGCQPLDVGVCQAELDGTTVDSPAGPRESDGRLVEAPAISGTAPPPPEMPPVSAGEIWQRELGALARAGAETTLQADLARVIAAREAGPEALVALAGTLRGPALDLAMDEIAAARATLWESAPAPAADPGSVATEADALQEAEAVSASNRARARSPLRDPAEGRPDATVARLPDRLPAAPAADLTVGSGCAYATVGAAVAAANPNDRLLIEGGVTFHEAVVVDKSLTLLGGYNGCASGSSDRTLIDAGGGNRVLDIVAGVNVTLQDLNLTNGSTTGEGGGIRFALGSGGGILTLTNVDVHANSAQWGGGVWIGPDAELVGFNLEIDANTASALGGGLRLYGGRATLSQLSNVAHNSAAAGGGVYGSQEAGFAPVLDLPSNADVHDNQALSGSGLGGGVYLSQGTLTAADCSDVTANDAVDGGGIYVYDGTITITGACSEIGYNSATGSGGGVYAQDSSVNLDDEAELYDNEAGTDGTGSGGGAYLDHGQLWGDKASLRYNSAAEYGGGIYATNASTVDMDLGSYVCLGHRCARVYGNEATSYHGGGIYANDSTITLDNIFVENNRANLGGGIYAIDTTLHLDNSLLARNNANGTAGDGIRLYLGAALTGAGNTLAYNDSGGASTGRAIDAASATVTLSCSVVWGHSSSITPGGEAVTYSDVQGAYAGTGNLDANPQFVAAGSYDYHLQSGSPVIDRCPAFSGLSPDFDNETRPVVRVTAATPYDMGADEATVDRVGVNGACAYGTVQQAVNAAGDGDTVRLAAGVYFETVDISGKDITLAGGYDGACTTATGDVTRLEGSAGSGSTVDVSNSTVTIQDLDIAWGQGIGGGVDARTDAAVTLDNVAVRYNHGTSGGGVYVSASSAVTITRDADIDGNTAAGSGGGALVYGQFFGADTSSDVTENCASDGGGLALPGGSARLRDADVMDNQAAGATGVGGGLFVSAGGAATLTGNAWLRGQVGYDGAGIYADNATITLEGPNVTLAANVAAHHGGGLYLVNDSLLTASGARVGHTTLSGYGNQASHGAGMYVDGSTVHFSGTIFNNVAGSAGAGLYASSGAITLTDAAVGGTGINQANRLGAGGHYGAGLYLAVTTQATLDHSVVAGNIFDTTGFTYGGGAYVSHSTLSLVNDSRVEQHIAPSATDGRGAGIYLQSSTATVNNSRVISNTAGAVGGGIRLLGSSTLNVINGALIGGNASGSGDGGGIAAGDDADITVSLATLSHNQAGGNGGAIYLEGGSLLLERAYVVGNTGVHGGAVYQAGGTADTEAANCLLAGNTSTGPSGAGIQVSGGAFVATHLTLADNAGVAYAIGGAGTSQVHNSIAWGNSGGGFVGAFGAATCNIDQDGHVGVSANPRFVDAGAADYRLGPGSPAIDACASGLALDLENTPRPVGAGYDMGAYEFVPVDRRLYLPVIPYGSGP